MCIFVDEVTSSIHAHPSYKHPFLVVTSSVQIYTGCPAQDQFVCVHL